MGDVTRAASALTVTLSDRGSDGSRRVQTGPEEAVCSVARYGMCSDQHF
jgi:hypothetical protein